MSLLCCQFPGNPLDKLIDGLGGIANVAEMTGRKKRIVRNAKGKLVYESRSKDTADSVNIKERKAFQSGQKLVAIISDAASTGISLVTNSC